MIIKLIKNFGKINSIVLLICVILLILEFVGHRHGEFKIEVGEAVSNYLEPIFSKYDSLSDKEIMSLMDTNLNVAKSSAKKTMEEVNSLLGI